MALLKRQAFFVMFSVSFCMKYCPLRHSWLFSCSVSLYPESKRWECIQTCGKTCWREGAESGLIFIYLCIRWKGLLPCRVVSRFLTYPAYLCGSDLLNAMSSEFGRITNPATTSDAINEANTLKSVLNYTWMGNVLQRASCTADIRQEETMM